MRNRRVKLAATAAACALLATGCGSSGSGGGSSATKDSDPASVTGTLRVLVPSYPASNEGKAALSKVVTKLNETYPKVKVEPDFATFDTLNQKISTSIAGGQPYDVYVTGVGWIPPFASKGVFADLSKYGVTKDSLAKQVNPALIPATLYEDKVYGVPLIAGPKPIAYSKSAFKAASLDPDAPPKNLTELEDAAKKLTKRSGGKLTQAGFDFWAPPGGYRQDFVAFLGALGVPLYDASGKPQFNSPAGVQALETMHRMISVDKVTDYGETSSTGESLVVTGKAAMGFAGGYVDCKKVGKKTCDDLAYFNLTEKDTAMFSGGQLASIGANTKLGGAAKAFVDAMSTPEGQADIAALNFAVPAGNAATDAPIVQSNPASQFAAESLEHAAFEGGTPAWLEVRDKFGPEIDKALLGKASAKDVLDDLASLAS